MEIPLPFKTLLKKIIIIIYLIIIKPLIVTIEVVVIVIATAIATVIVIAFAAAVVVIIFANHVALVVQNYALYIKNKKADVLAAAITASVAGTSEPALFGFVMKDIKALLSLTIGCFFGGLLSGLFKVKSYAMASFGVFGLITTIGPESSIVHAVISMIVGCVVGFIVCFITHRKYG